MSPEQAALRAVDHRSDLYTIALVLHELLSGVRTIERGPLKEMLHSVVRKRPEPLSPASLGSELVELVSRALSKRPDERYQSARALSAALRNASAHLTLRDEDGIADFLLARFSKQREALHTLRERANAAINDAPEGPFQEATATARPGPQPAPPAPQILDTVEDSVATETSLAMSVTTGMILNADAPSPARTKRPQKRRSSLSTKIGWTILGVATALIVVVTIRTSHQAAQPTLPAEPISITPVPKVTAVPKPLPPKMAPAQKPAPPLSRPRSSVRRRPRPAPKPHPKRTSNRTSALSAAFQKLSDPADPRQLASIRIKIRRRAFLLPSEGRTKVYMLIDKFYRTNDRKHLEQAIKIIEEN